MVLRTWIDIGAAAQTIAGPYVRVCFVRHSRWHSNQRTDQTNEKRPECALHRVLLGGFTSARLRASLGIFHDAEREQPLPSSGFLAHAGWLGKACCENE